MADPHILAENWAHDNLGADMYEDADEFNAIIDAYVAGFYAAQEEARIT